MEEINNYKELELKFRADDISLVKFQELMATLFPQRLIEVSSHDIYYTNKNNDFIRFRKSEIKPELTIKRKNTDKNNQDRIEVNVPVNTSDENLISAFAHLLGYRKNFKIFKSCWIYFFENVDIVYYCVYDENMHETGRFIEIEVLEDKNLSKEKSFEELYSYEQKLSSLGISPKNRMKKSLFELYKNDEKE